MSAGTDWLTSLTPDDLDVFGLEYEPRESARDVLARYAREFDVDLDQVGRCLDFLRSGTVMLCGGAPVAILAYSPRTGRWQASFDGDSGDDLGEVTTPRAGVWLTLLASEIGTLPTDAEHPLALRLPPVSTADAAFWRCVGHALR